MGNFAARLLYDRKRSAVALVFALAVFVPVLAASRAVAGPALPYIYPSLWSLFTAITAFFIIYTDRVSFYRRIFFAVLAVSFILHFRLRLPAGAAGASCGNEAPFCHIAIAPSFFNYLYQQYLAVMSGSWRFWGPLSLAFLWLFFTLVIGRAWCSWACFYGGIDDTLRSLPRRSLLKTDPLSGRFRDFPAALLVFMLLISLASMLPSYCLWLCPFKATAGFLEPDDAFIRGIQLGLMVFALSALLIAPLLTKKRVFCSFLCPFGAWQAFWGRLNPFRISVDREACSACGACTSDCPICAIKPGNEGKPEITAYCNLCGSCLSVCPRKAIRYSVLGKTAGPGAGLSALLDPRNGLVFSALVTAGAFGALFAPAALKDLLDLIIKR